MIEYEEKLIERNEKVFQEILEYNKFSQLRIVRNIIDKLEEYEEVGIKLEIEILEEYQNNLEITIIFLQKIQEKIGIPAFWIAEQAIEKEKNFR